MQNHVEQTIIDLTNQILAITACRDSLVAIFSVAVGRRSPSAPSEHSDQPAARNLKPVRKPITKRSNSVKAARTESAGNTIAAAASLADPITPASLSKASGLSKNGAFSAIHRWSKSGWVKKVGPGKYSRTAKFPAAEVGRRSPSAPSQPSAKPEVANRADLERKLADALKQRDYARENNRAEIVSVFQREIDHLTAQLS